MTNKKYFFNGDNVTLDDKTIFKLINYLHGWAG